MAIKHTVRTKNGKDVQINVTRSLAIKLMCTECLGWGEDHPKNCTAPKCPLFPFRGRTTKNIIESK